MAKYIVKSIRRDLYEVMKTACNTDKVNSCIEKLVWIWTLSCSTWSTQFNTRVQSLALMHLKT
jgi:hypothetical protein